MSFRRILFLVLFLHFTAIFAVVTAFIAEDLVKHVYKYMAVQVGMASVAGFLAICPLCQAKVIPARTEPASAGFLLFIF